MFGAIGALEGELIDYIPTWHHGLGMMRFLPERPRTNAPTKVAEQYGGSVAPMTELTRQLEFADVIVSATASPHTVAHALGRA